MEKCKPSIKLKLLTFGYMTIILSTSFSPYDFTFMFNTNPIIQNLLHIPIFTILAILLIEFLRHYFPEKLKLIFSVLLISMLFGLLNEFIQNLTPGRFMGGIDMLLNLIGAVAGIMLSYLVEALRPGLIRNYVCE